MDDGSSPRAGVLVDLRLPVLVGLERLQQEDEEKIGLLFGPLPGHCFQDLGRLLQGLIPLGSEARVALPVSVGGAAVHPGGLAGGTYVGRVGKDLQELGTPAREGDAALIHDSTSLGSRPIPERRSRVTAAYFGSRSRPRQTRPVCSAATAVVPDPKKGSNTRSPA